MLKRSSLPKVELTKAQAEFVHSRAPIVGFVGGRGAGKTWAGAYRVLKHAKRGAHYLVVAPTYTMLRDVCWPSVLEKTWELQFVGDTVRSRLVMILRNGATVFFRSADQPDRLRGLNIAGAWLDEASLMQRDVFDVVQLALRQGKGAWMACTFTPKGKSHWTYELFGHSRPGVETIRCPTRQNPFLPQDFEERVRAQTSATLLQQELEAEFIDVQGADWPSEYWGDWVLVENLPARNRWTVSAVTVDPSLGKQDKAGDYSAIVLVVICDDLLFVKADLQKRSPQKLITDLIALCLQHTPDLVGFEANQFQELLIHEFDRAADTAFKTRYPIFKIQNRVSKLVRIRRLGPYITRRELRIVDDLGGRLLLQQLQEFPVGVHDDGPDALEMAIRLILEASGGYYVDEGDAH